MFGGRLSKLVLLTVNLVRVHDRNCKSSCLHLTLPFLVTTEPKQVHKKGNQNVAQLSTTNKMEVPRWDYNPNSRSTLMFHMLYVQEK